MRLYMAPILDQEPPSWLPRSSVVCDSEDVSGVGWASMFQESLDLCREHELFQPLGGSGIGPWLKECMLSDKHSPVRRKGNRRVFCLWSLLRRRIGTSVMEPRAIGRTNFCPPRQRW
jgi:hypothetical protein